MSLTTFSDPQAFQSTLGNQNRQRRTLRTRLDRMLVRLQVRFALWSVRNDLNTIPSYVLADIGIRADDVDRAVRTATLVVVRRAIRTKLHRYQGLKDGGARWTT